MKQKRGNTDEAAPEVQRQGVAEGRPTFSVPAWVVKVPSTLRELPLEAEILVRYEHGGIATTASCTARELIEVLNERIQRQARRIFTVSEAAQILADALPGSSASLILKKMLTAHRGSLPFRDPGDMLPKLQSKEQFVIDAFVSVPDIDEWLKAEGANYRFPADPMQLPPEVEPDPQRRINSLRALGGNVKYLNGDWKIVGIGKLVAQETKQGRKRTDPKTIRADLKQAAEDERREGKSAATVSAWPFP